jgi:hypothetical protein
MKAFPKNQLAGAELTNWQSYEEFQRWMIGTKIMPKGLDEIHYEDISKKANGKVLHATFRH